MTELTWDGKYRDGKIQGPVRIALPFQTIETVNESAQDRQRSLKLFASGRESEWRNGLIWGDKKYVLPSLLSQLSGKVNLIYIDPPFDTGADFSLTATIPERPGADDDEAISFTKTPSILEQKAYRDTWGRGQASYLQWFYETAVLLYALLAEDGSIYVHIGPNLNHAVRFCLEEIFGAENFQAEIVWKRVASRSHARKLPFDHDYILLFTKSAQSTWNPQFLPHNESYLTSHYRHVEPVTNRRYRLDNVLNQNPDRPNLTYNWKGVTRTWRWTKEKMAAMDKAGRLVYTKTGTPEYKRYLDEMPGVLLQSIWSDIPPINSQSKEDSKYPTQKPEALLNRIITASSNEGDLILDCFCGSGTTAIAAEKLARRWIVCDLSRFGVHITRKRLLGVSGVRPFVVQNLGKYERQAWQSAEFPVNGKNLLEEQRQREDAYRTFILELYHATPFIGSAWIHGLKGGRMVHVGAVDAPVTLADVKAIARETWKATGDGEGSPRRAAVDVLGWEFAFELNELAKQVAAQSKVAVAFKKIPHEVLDRKAVEQGDVQFFELGSLDVLVTQKKHELKLALKDFLIPYDDIPSDVQSAIKHWSQLIDYWAVDWDFRGDTFHNQWQAYRTPEHPKIELEASHIFENAGTYNVVIKVIDILGNDTTKTIAITVR